MNRQMLPNASNVLRRTSVSGEVSRSEIIDSTCRQLDSSCTPQKSWTDSTKQGA